MSIALYRKYRPQRFSDVTNQNHIKITLQNEIENKKLAHAYLFCGPRGTGKTTMARLFSKAVNCENLKDKSEPCNECSTCREIKENRSLDIMEIDAASHTGVDNVRENIINNTRFTPAKLKYKVFIIDEVHMLSVSAFNALLKILEEPPEYVIFILATTEVHKVPVTIVSRCQRFDFNKIILTDLVARLNWIISQEDVKVDAKVIEYIARQSGGCVRDAESLLEQVLSLGGKVISVEQAELVVPRVNYQNLVDVFLMIKNKDAALAVEKINALSEEGTDLENFIKDFVEFLRQCLVYKLADDPEDLAAALDESLLKKVLDNLADISLGELKVIIETFLRAKDQIKTSPLLQLPLEMAIVELCSVSPVNMIVQRKITSDSQKEKKEVVISESKTVLSDTAGKIGESPASSSDFMTDQIPASQETEEAQPEGILEDQEQAAANNVARVEFCLENVNKCWPVVLRKIKDQNYAIYLALRMAVPHSVSDNKLILSFKFALQSEQIENLKNKVEVEKVLEEEFSRKIAVETKVDSDLQIDLKQKLQTQDSASRVDVKEEIKEDLTDEEVQNIVNMFG